MKKKLKEIIVFFIVLTTVASVSASADNYNKQPQQTNDYSNSSSADTSDTIYILNQGEEFVFGKIGLDDSKNIKYTFAVVRKPNLSKKIYKREFNPYGPRGIGGGRVMRLDNNPKDYDRYDYWVVFNGKKFGPYDRIVEMYQNKPDIDKWVSADGKSISFAGVRGQRYYSVINSNNASGFWTCSQAPSFDRLSGQNMYSMQYRHNSYWLYQNRKVFLKGWKYIKGIKFADNKEDFLYVGAMDNKYEKYVYVNHEQIAGPYYLISKFGFIPGTSKVYCAGFDRKSNYKFVKVGNKKIPVPDGNSVSNLSVDKDRVFFTLSWANKKAPKKNIFARKKYKVCEYDLKTGKIKKYGNYYFALYPKKFNGKIYYQTYTSKGDHLFVKHGGKILDRLKRSQLKGASVFYKIAPDGSCYTYYKKKNRYIVRKNGKQINLKNLNGKFAWIDSFRFDPVTGKEQLVINLDSSVASKKKKIFYGNTSFYLNGDTWAKNIFFASGCNDVYSVHRYIKSHNDWRYQLFKNGKPVDNNIWSGIAVLTTAGNGRGYAMLVSRDVQMGLNAYWTENKQMNLKTDFIVNGRIKPGRYGAPVWLPCAGKFAVLKQEDDRIVVSKFD